MDPRRRGRGELDRTPPDYQVVIKFLLMASLLAASTSLEGRSTGCGLMRRSEQKSETERMLSDSRTSASEDVRRPLQSLGLEEQWYQLDKTAPLQRRAIVPKVVALLLFNTFVIWSDMGHAVFDRKPSSGQSCPVLRPVLRAVLEVSAPPEVSQPYWGCARGHEVLTSTHAYAHGNVSRGQEPVCIASEAAALGTCVANNVVEGGEVKSVTPVTPWVEAVLWAQLAALAALALLVAAVVWIPSCPDVLEMACPVLVT